MRKSSNKKPRFTIFNSHASLDASILAFWLYNPADRPSAENMTLCIGDLSYDFVYRWISQDYKFRKINQG